MDEPSAPDWRPHSSRGAWFVLAVLAASLIACSSPAESPSPSASGGGPAETADAATAHLPPGCEPINLRATDGSRVELDGTWVEQSRSDAGQLTWWIRTQGNCLYGVGSVDEVPEEGPSMNPGTVIHYMGTIQPDYTVEGPMLHLGPLPGHAPDARFYEEVRFLIEFPEGGGILLREDRLPGVVTGGPRCMEQSFCFPPLVLVPREG